MVFQEIFDKIDRIKRNSSRVHPKTSMAELCDVLKEIVGEIEKRCVPIATSQSFSSSMDPGTCAMKPEANVETDEDKDTSESEDDGRS